MPKSVRRQQHRGERCLWYALVLVAFSAGAEPTDVSRPLKQSTECMLDVLKSVPGISEPRLGNTTSDGVSHPYLECRAAEGSRWIQPTRFYVQQSNNSHYWQAMLPGMMEIDVHATNDVVRKWKTQCGVKAYVLFG
jgi:hypothetical protein